MSQKCSDCKYWEGKCSWLISGLSGSEPMCDFMPSRFVPRSHGTYKAQLIGPMTGLPDYNRPAFAAAASRLRLLGYRVFNPGDWSDVPEPGALTWDDWTAWALDALDHADIAVLLPGWSASRGARREFARARQRGIILVDYGTGVCRRQTGRAS